MRRSKARSKLAAKLVAKITMPLNASSSRRRTLIVTLLSRSIAVAAPAERRIAMASASSKKSTAFCSAAERNAAATFFGVSPSHIDSASSVVDNQQLHAELVRDRFGADRLSGPRRSGEVKRQAAPCGVPLTQTPALEDQCVITHLGQCLIEGASRLRR